MLEMRFEISRRRQAEGREKDMLGFVVCIEDVMMWKLRERKKSLLDDLGGLG